jgi:biopolymer transport protein ExbB
MNPWLLSGMTLLAQAEPGPGADATAVQVQSVWDFVLKGGPMMIPIGLCSLLALAVIVERLLTLRRSKVIPPDFMTGLRPVMDNNGDGYRGALEYCRENASPIANVFTAGIRSLGASVELVEKHIEQAGEREVFKLRKYLRMLSVIASIAPLMGLLGTIFGMIIAFQTVAASGEALGRTEMLAKGIYQAMITTAAGLMVAIPVLIGYHWISGKIERLVGEMDRMTVEFVEKHALNHAPAPAAAASDDAPAAPEQSVPVVKVVEETPTIEPLEDPSAAPASGTVSATATTTPA